ncbi:glutamyl aminopeptidase isoform X1 [Pieris napi]|uniref:glutamyl aminopeptidase isoform X1 n=2 Tax=Pieris napi TaxID=78633 RepID=UPI001FBB321F|nr:glutamyl aminopeptidase isoform X1 [Pieris napi]XP_047509220.1 glutamyl aminopeptidase isoform X1 [Pieris napi]
MKSDMMSWACPHKVIVMLSLLSFSLFVSTIALSVKSTTHRVEGNILSTDISKKTKTKEDHVINYRLSRDVRPLNYTLILWPDLERRCFKGQVTIRMRVLRPTTNIEVHVKNLSINYVDFNDDANRFVQINTTNLIPKREVYEVQFGHNEISEGVYKLTLNFTGKLDTGIVGFYQSKLRGGLSMVASKFQPTYARQAFPCFDEPDFKATYDITLVKPIDYVALSNMNEISKSVDKSTKTETVTFATSVPMSTYLACFVVCNFDYKETLINTSGIGKDFTLRSFAQKQQTHKIDFAQDIGKRATEFYIKYYEVPYPLPKLDMIAIPDYVSGATEHWGLITYRETSFLVDEATTSSQNKISVANTIAHELAHMWFGNLVTMKWWDEVWLNEGFASYMQVKSLNAIEPSWTMLDQFLTKTLHSVLVTDAKLSSHPIVQKVETPDQITAIFDSISYNKGASILRMLEGFIGEENFRKGVSDYLKKYKYGNTVTQELLSSLEPYFKTLYPHLSLKYIMDTWTRQMGYPLITVRPAANNIYILTQSRFLLDPAATYDDDSEFHYRWYVPITYSTSKEKRDDILWFADTSDSVEISLSDDEKLLKINNNQMGYYRVNYPLDMWSQIIEQLKVKSNMLTISDRAHLLDDAFALSDAGILPYDIALSLTQYLPVEKDFVPWETASAKFSHLSKKLINTPAYENLKKYVQHLISGLYTEQSWEKTNLDVIQGLLRTRVLTLAASSGLPDAERRVRNMFLNWLNSHGTNTIIEPDLRSLIYYYGMKHASAEDWEKLWALYLQEEDVQEQTKLRSALSAPEDVAILKRYLNLAWDEKNIRSQDYLNVLQLISTNPSGNGLVWDEVRNRWNTLVDRFTLNSRYLGNLIPAITSGFNTEKQLQEMISFFEENSEAGAGASARQRALENVRNNIKWTSSHQSTVASWLENYVKAIKSI